MLGPVGDDVVGGIGSGMMGFGGSWERAHLLYGGSGNERHGLSISCLLFVSGSDFRHALTSAPRPRVWTRTVIVHGYLSIGDLLFFWFPRHLD